MDTPFQILECNLHGFVEIICIISLDRDFQRLTYAETVFRQLCGIFVVEHLILVAVNESSQMNVEPED